MRTALALITRYKPPISGGTNNVQFRTLVADASGITSPIFLITTSLTASDGLAIYVVNSDNAAPTGLSDTAGNTYIQIGTAVFSSNSAYLHSQWYCKNVASTASVTITATWAGTHTFRGMAILPLFGHDTAATPAGIVGPEQSSVSTTDGITTTNITPSAQPGVIVAMTSNDHGNAQAAGTGFTDRGSSFTNWAGTLSLGTRAESATYSSLSAAAATFTNQGDGLGKNVTPGMMIPSA